MSRKLLLSLAATALLVAAFTSCKKDISEEELLKSQLAQADSLLKRGGVIKYTVKVVSAANSSFLKAKMSLENAIVTVYQNDKVYNATTDANGFAIFTDMRVGTVSVNVKLKDHAEVDYVADITPQDNLTNLSQTQIVNTIRYASTMVPMFPIADPGCATITGKVTAELDLTNTTPEPAEGVKVTATVDVDDPDFVARYIAPTQGTTSSPSAGRILKYAFNDASVTATTAADGTYTLKVPASVNGLPVKLSVADYQTNQKLYLENDPADGSFKPGEYTVPVLFSSNVEPCPIPVVKPVYVVVDEPTAPIGIVTKSASFTLEVDASGSITKVNIINKGKYSAKPSIIAIGSGTGAILDATFNSTTGEIDGITIVTGGKNYKTTDAIYASLVQLRKKAILEPVIDNDGYIYTTEIVEKGAGYITTPNLTIINTDKNSITPVYNVVTNYWRGEISKLQLVNAGYKYRKIMNIPQISSSNSLELTENFVNLSNDSFLVKNISIGTGNRQHNK